MSNANANSSTKVASLKKEVEKIKIVMGPFSAVLNDKEYMLVMDPETARAYTEEMVELAIPVKTYTKTIDSQGRIVARVDDKTGKNLMRKKAKSIAKDDSSNNKEEQAK